MTILYVAYWGLLEPLGQSLILPTIRGLARQGFSLAVISFEKPDALRDTARRNDLAQHLEACGIQWRPLRYHKRPTIPATLFDVVRGVLIGLALGRRRRAGLVHGRTPMGALMGMLLGKVLGIPFVCHHEGFWADQQVEGGYWRSRSLLHRAMKRLERTVHEHAHGIVLLSERSRVLVEAFPGLSRKPRPTIVVPSCVDLARFADANRVKAPEPGTRLVYLGSLGGRYLIDPLGRFFRAYSGRTRGAKLTILSHSDRTMIQAALGRQGLDPDAVSIDFVPADQVPGRLAGADAGMFFLVPGRGALTCSATKIGEYWAAGIPVVLNSGIGDADEAVMARKVGVIIRDWSDEALAEGIDELISLLEDPRLSERCRKAARELYSLEIGLERLTALYAELLPRNPGEAATA